MDREVYEVDKRADTQYIKCQNCGGNMVFDPSTQSLSCPFCGNLKDIEKDIEVQELEIESAFSAAKKWDDVSVLNCENCGAKIIISTNEVSKECPYCGTSHIRKSEDLAGIRPNALYPFKYTTDEAEQFCKKWVKTRIFAPRRFKKSIEARNIHGVFEPIFTFDSDTSSKYKGRIGKTKTRTVHTKNGTKTETYVEWRHVSGTIDHFFDDVTISAGNDLDQAIFNKLMPFDKSSIKVYNKDFLAGYTAKHYDKDLTVAWNESKSIMDEKIRKLILDKYNCDVTGYLDVFTLHNKVTYKYVLMPIYILNYLYKRKNYRLNVNGNSGKIAGKTPLSFWRVLVAVLLGVGLLALIVFAMSKGDVELEFSALKSLLIP